MHVCVEISPPPPSPNPKPNPEPGPSSTPNSNLNLTLILTQSFKEAGVACYTSDAKLQVGNEQLDSTPSFMVVVVSERQGENHFSLK